MRKIFSDKTDDEIHEAFLKYGRGIFKNKYLLEAKKQKDKWSIKSSAEFANYFVRRCLEKVSGEIDVKGVIVYTHDLRNDIKFNIKNVKQFMGVKQFVLEGKIKTQDILELMNKHPRAFYALSFSTPSSELKIKAKAPKGAKPSTKGEGEAKADFCSLKTSDLEIVRDLFFNLSNFKEIKVKHTLQIDSVILPQGIQDPVKIREMAKKKGKIIRDIIIDGKKEVKEKEFVA